jgi:hypothetical protein
MKNCKVCGKEIELGIMDDDKDIICIKCSVLESKPGTMLQKKNQLKSDIIICKQNIEQYNRALKSHEISDLIKNRIEKALKSENWKLNILQFVAGDNYASGS